MPTPYVGPFVMSVEFPTPQASERTHRIPYEEVPTIEEAVAWIRHPPFPPEILKKLKKGVLLTARTQAEWVQENGQHGEEIAAMGLVLRVGTKNVPAKIAVVTRDGISIDGEMVTVAALRLSKKTTYELETWQGPDSSAVTLLSVCEGAPLQLLTLTACAVVRTVLRFVPDGEDRPRVALETAEAWAYGHATVDQVERAAEDVQIAIFAKSPKEAAVQTAARQAAATAWQAWRAKSAADWANTAAVHTNNERRALIVRQWIHLPEVFFANITMKQ